MIYELVNPSDAYTLKSGDERAAFAAALLLGEGMYGLKDESGETLVPISFFDQRDTFREKYGVPLLQWIDDATNKIRVAKVLDSVLIGDRADRARMERVMAAISSDDDRKRALAAWHDERRSSMNDIGSRAVALATRLRER